MSSATDWLDKATDDELRAELNAIDDSDTDLTNWEGQFIESILFKKALMLTPKQRETVIKIVRKYT